MHPSDPGYATMRYTHVVYFGSCMPYQRLGDYAGWHRDALAGTPKPLANLAYRVALLAQNARGDGIAHSALIGAALWTRRDRTGTPEAAAAPADCADGCAALAQELGADVEVASAGISAVDGQPASGHAQTVARVEGLNLEEHRSARIAPASIEAADLVLTMTAAHREALHREWPQHRDRVLTLGEAAGVDADVTDPYGGTVEDYETTSREIGRLLRAAWPAISRRLAI